MWWLRAFFLGIIALMLLVIFFTAPASPLPHTVTSAPPVQVGMRVPTSTEIVVASPGAASATLPSTVPTAITEAPRLAATAGAAGTPAGLPPGAKSQAASVQATPASGGWQLVFGDEFDGPTLDPSKWTPNFWWGNTHGDAELQYYAANNLEFSNGILRLRVDKRPMNGHPYASGMISSHGKFNQEHGYFEMRARVPKGPGLWPAFWLIRDLRTGVTWPPEIDVMEVLGGATNVVHVGHHLLDSGGQHLQEGHAYTGPDFSAEFHTYAVEWNPSTIVWYIDGVQRFHTRIAPPTGRMYLIANLAVGHWAGPPDSTTPFPSYFDIDYIRGYKKAAVVTTLSASGGSTTTQTNTPDPTTTSTPGQ